MIGLEKILRKEKDKKPTAKEEELVKQLIQHEINADMKDSLKGFGFLSVEEIKVNDKTTALLVTIPFPLLAQFHKLAKALLPKLEEHFNAPVLFIAKRTIISRHLKIKRTQQIPRSRTLTSVHKAILDDLIFPYTILEQREHVNVEGKSIHKVCFNDKAKELFDACDKKQAIEAIYKKLTCKSLMIDFINVPSKIIKKKKDKKEEA